MGYRVWAWKAFPLLDLWSPVNITAFRMSEDFFYQNVNLNYLGIQETLVETCVQWMMFCWVLYSLQKLGSVKNKIMTQTSTWFTGMFKGIWLNLEELLMFYLFFFLSKQFAVHFGGNEINLHCRIFTVLHLSKPTEMCTTED